MKKIIIIGGGVAGLTAGIYARRSGFECEIYEQHTIVGGECTSWKRHGFHIDNCVHWLTGTNPNTEMNKVWCDIHALGKDVEIIQNDSFMHIEGENGESLDIWQDVERLRTDLLKLSPEDADAIEEFISNVKTYCLMDMPALKPVDMLSIMEFWRLLKKLRPIGKIHGKLSRMSLQEYADKFKHPLLKKMILAYMPNTYNVSSWFYVLGTFCSGNGALPRGGSQGMIDRMEKYFLDLGGKIFTRKKAIKLDVEKKIAQCVHFSDGTTATADYIICCCDVSVVFNKLLEEEHTEDFFKHRFIEKLKHPIYSTFNTYIAVDDKCEFLKDTTWFNCAPYKAVGKEHNSVLLKSFSSEPTYSPEGKNLLQTLLVQYEDDFERWATLYEVNREAYKIEKDRISKAVLTAIEEKYPQLKGKMTVVETVSPYSYYRFCGAYKGAYMSFILTPFAKKKTHKGRLRKIKNVYLAGQWLQPPGGLPNAGATGRFVIQRICKQEKIAFDNNFTF